MALIASFQQNRSRAINGLNASLLRKAPSIRKLRSRLSQLRTYSQAHSRHGSHDTSLKTPFLNIGLLRSNNEHPTINSGRSQISFNCNQTVPVIVVILWYLLPVSTSERRRGNKNGMGKNMKIGSRTCISITIFMAWRRSIQTHRETNTYLVIYCKVAALYESGEIINHQSFVLFFHMWQISDSVPWINLL